MTGNGSPPGPGVSYRHRVRGCLLGGALGDALGAGVEFLTLGQIRAGYGPAGVIGPTPAYGVAAPITDDTQMTLFTAEGLIRASVRQRSKGICHPPSVVWRSYRRWLVTQQSAAPPGDPDGWLAAQPVLYASRAPGNACLSGLRRAEMGTPQAPANPDSKGCGAVMRSAPFGLLRRDRETVWRLAADCAVLTHGHPTGYLAAAAFAWIIAEIVDGSGMAAAVSSALDRLAGERRGGEVAKALRQALDAATGGAPRPEDVERLGAGWVAEEALAIAVCCAVATVGGGGAHAAPANTHTARGHVRAALLAAVNHSGDSDSTGAICGNIVGAAYGEAALPTDWLAALDGREVVGQVADDVVQEIENTAEVSDDWGGATTEWSARYPGA